MVNRSKSNQESESSRDSSELVSKVPSSDFQLAQFVVAVGVMRRELRYALVKYKKLSCRGEAARCFVSCNSQLRHSLKVIRNDTFKWGVCKSL